MRLCNKPRQSCPLKPRLRSGGSKKSIAYDSCDAASMIRTVLYFEFTEAVNKVVDLFVRITADEKALSALHQARPPGVMEHLLSAELHARGLDRFTRDTPSLLTSVCLFDWNSGRQIGHRGGRQWQRRSPHPWCQRMTPPTGRTTTSGAPRRSRGSDSMTDYYARTTREQEERENREARERFAASQRKNSV